MKIVKSIPFLYSNQSFGFPFDRVILLRIEHSHLPAHAVKANSSAFFRISSELHSYFFDLKFHLRVLSPQKRIAANEKKTCSTKKHSLLRTCFPFRQTSSSSVQRTADRAQSASICYFIRQMDFSCEHWFCRRRILINSNVVTTYVSV